MHYKPTAHAANAISSQSLMTYLDKENDGLEYSDTEREYWFSHDKEFVPSWKVQSEIDHAPRQGLKTVDAKFHHHVVSFSQDELKGISDTELKRFAQEKIMSQIRDNFIYKDSTGKERRNVGPENFIIFGRLEHQRKYSTKNEADRTLIREGKVKDGELKAGDQRHFHFVTAAKDRQNSCYLNPHAAKKYYSRDDLKINLEKSFDKEFGYNRGKENSYEYQQIMKHGTIEQKQQIREQFKEKEQGINKEKSYDLGY